MPSKSIPTLIDWPPLEEKLRDLGLIALGHPEATTIFYRGAQGSGLRYSQPIHSL